MEIKTTPHAGWKNNLQLSSKKAELVISLDVGPRILSYRTTGGTNVLKNYPEQMGGSGETKWMIRGGHRLWIAPEDEILSYVPDNQPVKHTLMSPNGVHLVNEGVDPWKIRKEMFVEMSEETSEVTIRHRASNEGADPVEIATWGLTVMVPGGLEIIPLPPLGEHPRDLLPNRTMVLWPYTDMSDPRFRFGWRLITVRQAGDGAPLKLGLSHKEKWVAYLTKDALFVKTFDYVEGEKYPDNGCNFETFTNHEMLEVESLSPLRKLAPGGSVEHTERWYLFGGIAMPNSLKERELAEWIQPYLKQTGAF
jgi:hypothetical protein